MVIKCRLQKTMTVLYEGSVEVKWTISDVFGSSFFCCIYMFFIRSTFCFFRLISSWCLAIQVPVRVAGGLLFELLGQSIGDPLGEDDIPIVLRSWQAQHFLVTALHVKGTASNINVIGITEVQVISPRSDRNFSQHLSYGQNLSYVSKFHVQLIIFPIFCRICFQLVEAQPQSRFMKSLLIQLAAFLGGMIGAV